ncbi:unnamed protein product [Protopolystoma xenopodis]|uniref:G-protein coupled receptors family 3 profile domain-containing protein n=1 Tax=Protopolystoma xenopodis TaxID=117903 RepID=A0A448WHE5_9PLAT|nr:unnamed protein product [Protopolystoma xenopodis]
MVPPEGQFNETVAQELRQLYPYSICSRSCRLGQATRYAQDSPCCWRCSDCSPGQYVLWRPTSGPADIPQYRWPLGGSGDAGSEAAYVATVNNEAGCRPCPPGTQSYANRTGCQMLEFEFLGPRNPMLFGVAAWSLAGLMACVGVGITYVCKWRTPVILASGRDTTLFLLFGMMASYVAPIALMMGRPSTTICALGTMAPGLCITICYAAIFTRTKRIAQIFLVSSPVCANYHFPTISYDFNIMSSQSR